MSQHVRGSLRTADSSAVSPLKSIHDPKLVGTKFRRAIPCKRELTIARSLAQRREDLIGFYGLYEELVDVLSDASHYGPTPKLESDYRRLRIAVQRNYVAIRPYVVAFLRYTPEDARFGLDVWGQSADAFEALVCAPTLEDASSTDVGWLISRITRTRDALNLYAEQLRSQFAESAVESQPGQTG